METKVKNRAWVKNAAIIFLAVLLVLTFFSNTILNASLPEVATREARGGSITARIRVTGAVTASQSYEVSIDESRRVRSVLVRTGQEVAAGDVLFVLSDGGSEELEAALDALRALQKQYQTALINAAGGNSGEVQRARSALSEDERTLDRLGYTDRTDADWDWQALAAAKDAAADADAAAKAAEDAVTKATEALTDLGISKPTQDALNSLSKAEETKRAALTEAQNALEATLLIYGRYYEWIRGRAEYQIQQTDGYRALKSSAQQKQYIEDRRATYEKHVRDQIENNQLIPPDVETSVREDANGDFTTTYVVILEQDRQKYLTAYSEVSAAQAAVKTAQEAYDEARAAYEKAQGDAVEYNRFQQTVDTAKEAQRAAAAAKTAADDQLKNLQSALDALKTDRRALEDALKQAQLDTLEMSDLTAQIEKQQKKVDELSEGAAGTEVTADVGGVIASIAVTAGQTTTPKAAMATIELPDMGYTLTATVTNDQARRLHVGDSATVANAYWGSQINATLTGIAPDPRDPQNSRQLSFELTGDVSAGSSLTLSVGERSADYDLIVPNSALRSDSNGDFVLIVSAKSSPLGDRYTATRVEVTKLAYDDTSTAVTGALEAGDFVITTSTAPIKNGDRVRLADSQNSTS